MALISLIRLVALCKSPLRPMRLRHTDFLDTAVVLGFSVIVLGLGAALTATTEKYLDGFFEFAALAIATASLTLITLPVMFVVNSFSCVWSPDSRSLQDCPRIYETRHCVHLYDYRRDMLAM